MCQFCHGYLRFSPDSKRLEYHANKGQGWAMVIDGLEGPVWDGVVSWGGIFTPDLRHVAYLANDGGKYRAVVDGIPGPACDHIGVITADQLTFHPDGTLEYTAMINDVLYRIHQKGKSD